VKRRSAMLAGAAIALAAVVVLVGLSGLLAADRRADLARYDDAVARQRREAGQAAPRPDDARPAARDTAYCVRGVDTFASTLHDAMGLSVVDDEKRLAPAALRRLSHLATRAHRYVEQAHAGPALPQRLGRTRVVAEDGATTWAPLSPPLVECEDGQGYAMFRIDTSDPNQPPPAAPDAQFSTRSPDTR